MKFCEWRKIELRSACVEPTRFLIGWGKMITFDYATASFKHNEKNKNLRFYKIRELIILWKFEKTKKLKILKKFEKKLKILEEKIKLKKI